MLSNILLLFFFCQMIKKLENHVSIIDNFLHTTFMKVMLSSSNYTLIQGNGKQFSSFCCCCCCLLMFDVVVVVVVVVVGVGVGV